MTDNPGTDQRPGAGALLAGKTAVITGGAQGIGLAIAETFAGAGAKVVVADVDGVAAGHAAEQLVAAGHQAIGVRTDVADEEQVERLIATCVDTYGSVDAVVNNAGVVRDATMRTMTIDQFRTVIDVNLTGTWLMTRAAGLQMRSQKSGTIVNLSSISGKVGLIGQTNYSAAKAGIVGLTKAAAKELAPHGVRVNAIQPGLILTPMTQDMRADIKEAKLKEIPLGRTGNAREVADVALFLSSEMSSYVTASVIEVTGGRYA